MRTLEEYLSLPYGIEIVPDTEEGGFMVSYTDLPGCLSCGESVEQGIANAAAAKKAWLEAAIEDSLEIAEPDALDNYSGQFKLRIPKSLHKSLAEHSKREGISMNQYCLYLLTKNDAIGKVIKKIEEYRKHVASSNGVNDVYRVNKAKAVDLLHKLIKTNFYDQLHETEAIDEDTVLSVGMVRKANSKRKAKGAVPEKTETRNQQLVSFQYKFKFVRLNRYEFL